MYYNVLDVGQVDMVIGIYQLSYQRIWKMSRKQIKHNFHPQTPVFKA
jgi:hypothetical protein